MKKVLVIIFLLFAVSCQKDSYEVYDTDLEKYVVSKKEMSKGRFSQPYIWFHTNTKMGFTKVSFESYRNIKKGDSIYLLIKYVKAHEEPKTKPAIQNTPKRD